LESLLTFAGKGKRSEPDLAAVLESAMGLTRSPEQRQRLAFRAAELYSGRILRGTIQIDYQKDHSPVKALELYEAAARIEGPLTARAALGAAWVLVMDRGRGGHGRVREGERATEWLNQAIERLESYSPERDTPGQGCDYLSALQGLAIIYARDAGLEQGGTAHLQDLPLRRAAIDLVDRIAAVGREALQYRHAGNTSVAKFAVGILHEFGMEHNKYPVVRKHANELFNQPGWPREKMSTMENHYWMAG
jgi:hypothetical protein